MSPTKFTLLVFLALSSLLDHAVADGLERWHWRNPLPSGNSIRGVAYGNGLLVAVSEEGVVQSSTDAITWSVSSRVNSNSLNAVAFGSGIFVAVGDEGTIYTSVDGTNWVGRVSGTATNLLTIQFGNALFVAGGAGGTVATSTNGVFWSLSSSGFSNDLNWSAFGNGWFLLPTSTPAATVLASTNGVNWLPRTVASGITEIFYTTHANGRFLAFVSWTPPSSLPVLCFFSSTDGASWTLASSAAGNSNSTHDGLFAAGNSFIDVMRWDQTTTDSAVRLSSDGQTWVQGNLPGNAVSLGELIHPVTGALYIEGKYVLVGGRGLVATSADGTDWTYVSSGPLNTNSGPVYRFAQVAAGNGVTVAVGGAVPYPPNGNVYGNPAAIVACTNGTSFAPVTPPQNFAAVGFGGGNFVAVGQGGILKQSTNGVDWSLRSSASSSDLASICYGSNLWVAVGKSGAIVTSPNSLLWTLRNSGTTAHLYGVGFGNGTYVAVGNTGSLLTSPDGVNWTPQFVDTSLALLKVAFGNGMFVVVGANGLVATSSDTVNWSVKPAITPHNLYGVSYGNGSFVAVGGPRLGYYDAVQNCMFRSQNGTSWTPLLAPTVWSLCGVSFANNRFWLAGSSGIILESDALSIPQMLNGQRRTNGYFELTINGFEGQSFRVQVCTNLSDWVDAVSISNSLAVEKWTDVTTGPSSKRFYRVVSP